MLSITVTTVGETTHAGLYSCDCDPANASNDSEGGTTHSGLLHPHGGEPNGALGADSTTLFNVNVS